MSSKKRNKHSHFEAASNFSLFFFRRHFHGLKSRPRALNLLFLSSGGVREPVLRLVVRRAVPLCFFTGREKGSGNYERKANFGGNQQRNERKSCAMRGAVIVLGHWKNQPQATDETTRRILSRVLPSLPITELAAATSFAACATTGAT
jgi:hypothetical protein